MIRFKSTVTLLYYNKQLYCTTSTPPPKKKKRTSGTKTVSATRPQKKNHMSPKEISSSNHQFLRGYVSFQGVIFKIVEPCIHHPPLVPFPPGTPEQNHDLVFNEAVFRRAAPAAGRSKRRVNFLVDLEVDVTSLGEWGLPLRAIECYNIQHIRRLFF